MPNTAALWSAWERSGRQAGFFGASPPPSVTFPSTPLRCGVFLALGADLTALPTTWVWTDITDYVRLSVGISTRQGRQDEQSTVTTSSGQLTVDNRDGRFSRRNPNSPYYGLLTRNTPIKCTVDAGSGPHDRMQMFVNEWPVRWSDLSGTDSTVPIRTAGILRRLQQGTVLKSAMKRGVLSASGPTPVAYWPCEDGPDATVVNSGLPGGAPMRGPTPVSGGAFGGSTGSLDLTTLAARSVIATASTSTSGFQVEFMAQANTGATVNMLDVVSGTFFTTLALGPDISDGQPHHISMSFVQNGSNVDLTQYRDGVLYAMSSIGGVLASTVNIYLPTIFGAPPALLAHLAVFDFADIGSSAARAGGATAYTGELATTRVRRLAAEEGVPMVCTSGVSVAMGPQTQDTFLNLLRECEAVDGGVLYEVNWGLGFQALNDRTNMPVALALDFNQKHIAGLPEPADDDQRLRNRWTVSRTGGSSVTVEQTTGPNSTATVGVYDDSATVNVRTDSQLGDQAGWRLHLGS